MRFKNFILLKEETFVYTIPSNVTPRVKDDIELISWKASITTTDYNPETIEDIKDSVFYINSNKQIRINKNSYYDEAQLYSKNIDEFSVPNNGELQSPDIINIPKELFEKLAEFVKSKGFDKIFKIDIFVSNELDSSFKFNDLPIYLRGRAIKELEEKE